MNTTSGQPRLRIPITRPVVAVACAVMMLTFSACTSSSAPPEPDSTPVTSLPGGGSGTTSGGSASIAFEPIAGAVPVKYDLSEGNARPIAETPVELSKPVKRLAMDIDSITYGGVVCGFTFKGSKPTPPLDITMTIDVGNGEVATAKVPLNWSGDSDQSGGGSDNGWNFGASAGPNQAGSGWVVQVGAIAAGGGKSVEPPKRSRCVLDSPVDIAPEAGPVHLWAGFATK